MIKEWTEGGMAFQYEVKIKENTVSILNWKDGPAKVALPDRIDGLPVTAIGRKAFLSNKRIMEIRLPAELSQVGEWAFAYCSRLQRIRLPKREILFEKGAFLQCENLEAMIMTEVSEMESGGDAVMREPQQCDRLLAATACKLDAPYLLDVLAAGTPSWMQQWDARLVELIERPDRDGYAQTLLCGEEDYEGRDNDLNYFLNQKRRAKVRLCMLRLINDMGLSAARREWLEKYLKNHTKGCASEEAWEVVRDEHGQEPQYFDLLLECGGVEEQNFDALLADTGNELAELKAHMLRRKEELFGDRDFFDSLSLD